MSCSPGSILGLPAVIPSAAMRRVMEMVKRVAQTDASVLVTGESGVGKELVARALHEQSLRCNSPWVDLNCGALPEHLVESELFGFEKGAFSGATQTKQGLLELAHPGTLFLDEIGDLDARLQVKAAASFGWRPILPSRWAKEDLPGRSHRGRHKSGLGERY